MPNGGMMPCCHLCRWANRNTTESSEVYCELHKIKIRSALSSFCAKLSNYKFLGLILFTKTRRLTPNTIYAWIEIGYQDPRNPSLPMYYAEYAALTSVKEYSHWTEEQEITARHNLRDDILNRLIKQGKIKGKDDKQ